MSERMGDWIQTFTGLQFWPLDPRPEEIVIEDIAHALSNQCRYAGHVKTFYSVAEHSWRCAQVCEPGNELWCLLHDASEAYLVDLPRPIKRFSALGDEYRAVEARLMHVICRKFCLLTEEPSEVKKSDDFMLAWEMRDLLGPPPSPWRHSVPLLPVRKIEPFTPFQAERAFLDSFSRLMAES